MGALLPVGPASTPEMTPLGGCFCVPAPAGEAVRARGMEVIHSNHNYEPAFASVQGAMAEKGVSRGGADPRRLSGAVAIAR